MSQEAALGAIRNPASKMTPLLLLAAQTTCTRAAGSSPACTLTPLPSLSIKEISAAGERAAKASSNSCFHMEVNASFKLL